jgi:hypothetical protein
MSKGLGFVAIIRKKFLVVVAAILEERISKINQPKGLGFTQKSNPHHQCTLQGSGNFMVIAKYSIAEG